MSLVDSKKNQLTLSQGKEMTVEEILDFFKKNTYDRGIDELLQKDEVEAYLQNHLIDNFKTFTQATAGLSQMEKENIEWLLNQDALRRDVKANIEVQLLRQNEDLEKACKNLTVEEIKDIIYYLEEELDDILDEWTYLSACQVNERGQGNVFRRRVVLLEA